MIDPRARQAAYNAASRDQWAGFAPHRARVSALLGAGQPAAPTRLVALGAGNANDLDLAALLDAHRAVHLVDLDPQALRAGATHQDVLHHPGLVLHAPVDLTGALDLMGCWTPTADVPRAHLDALVAWPADRVAPGLPGPFDHVASVGLLSQLIATAHDRLGPRHPHFGAVVRALRTGHLHLLARLAAPGGRITFVTDVVSTDHLPELADLPDDRLAALFPRLAREGRHIHGVHPDQIVATLRSDPRLRPLDPIPPWRWRLHRREYLVWAITLRMTPAIL